MLYKDHIGIIFPYSLLTPSKQSVKGIGLSGLAEPNCVGWE